VRFLLIVLGLVLFSAAGIADEATLAPGARVRVTLLAREAPQVTGRVLAIPADSLVVAAEPDSLARVIAHLDIEKLEVTRGMRSNAGRGAVIGSLLGAASGAFFSLFVPAPGSDDGDFDNDDDHTSVRLAGAGVGAIVGAGLGALIGCLSKHQRWNDVLVNEKPKP